MNENIKENDDKLKYEYLVIDATVKNNTAYFMNITGSNLSWGKWDTSPVNVKPHEDMKFLCRGRDSSPSGTEGWATWTLEGHPKNPTIKVTFNNPAVGSDRVNISCEPKGCVSVTVSQTKGKYDRVTYIVG